jgi:putative endonuclease
MKTYSTYILTNKAHTVLYTGVTNNLVRRVLEHRNKVNPTSFTARYNVSKLVYYCIGGDVYGAIEHEKKIKGKSRKNKMKLVSELNPDWKDLSAEIGLEEADLSF